ncbi:response regulator transcription factor [Alicyclobacillus sp. ALC3]|uniref:response regulator transcription factor n=1 Tax=Alicyclobacillus sp. ALC3 TaxID=2796143 RepID=UPI002378D1AA|nr:helix-turn-helix transcriptional regulator [Alicyclobacillus sp. ALC3]
MGNNHPLPSIRLILQFQVEYKGTPIQKQVMLDLEPESSGASTNPIRVVNRTVATILRVLGETVQSPVVFQQEGQTGGMKVQLRDFTAREMDVLTHLITGATNAQIANLLGVSPNTVKYHVKNILQKLHVKNRVELASKLNHY